MSQSPVELFTGKKDIKKAKSKIPTPRASRRLQNKVGQDKVGDISTQTDGDDEVMALIPTRKQGHSDFTNAGRAHQGISDLIPRLFKRRHERNDNEDEENDHSKCFKPKSRTAKPRNKKSEVPASPTSGMKDGEAGTWSQYPSDAPRSRSIDSHGEDLIPRLFKRRIEHHDDEDEDNDRSKRFEPKPRIVKPRNKKSG